jgi:hypothetical protein
MQVFYRAVRGARRAAVTTYEATRVVFCCAAMERQWGRLIGFGVRGCARSTSRDVNLFGDRAQVGGRTILEVTAIAFCPWCGETVEPCRVK